MDKIMNIPVFSRIIKISDTLFELMQIEIKHGNNYFKMELQERILPWDDKSHT